MINFEKYSKNTLKKYLEFIKSSPFKCCDLSLGAFIMFGESANLELAEKEGSFFTKQDIIGDPVFSFPCGNTDNSAIDRLFEHVEQNNLPFVLYGINDEMLVKIKKDKRFNSAIANYDRRWSDYIYSFEEMKTFAGGKFSGQRNHINKFIKSYGAPCFSKIEESDLSSVKEMLHKYALEHPARRIKEEEELKATKTLLDACLEFDLPAGKLTVGDKVVGFSIGEIVGDTLIIHVEKALTEYQGVYPTLFNSFVKYVGEINPNLNYVNREDDSGDAGLRKSKLQYKPTHMVNKYLVKVKPYWQVNDYPTLIGDGIVLNKIEDSDKQNYLALCTDEELNKLWGYDYKQDESITSDIDENTFFDMQAYDNSVGFSINLAIREKLLGELLGEIIIYNSTYNGDVELGCRIAKAHHGKGLGKKALALAAKYAESLNLKPHAKCFKQNVASKKIILANGFTLCKEDEEFYHFIRK